MLLFLPPEVIHNIAAFLLCSPSPNHSFRLGPPTSLPAVLLTHRILYHHLSPVVNPNLSIWREAYCARFDSSAALRRCTAGTMKAERYLNQLENNFRALRFFRRGDVYADRTNGGRDEHGGHWPSPLTWFPPIPPSRPPLPPILPSGPPHRMGTATHTPPMVPPQPQYHPNPLANLACTSPLNDEEPSLDEALLTALVMVLEDDGKNAQQLVGWGRAREFCLECMRRRWVEENLHGRKGDREGKDKGWVEENLRNSVVVSVFWGLCDRGTLPSLPRSTLEHLLGLLSPIVHNPFRYPSAEYPPQWFRLPFSSTRGAAPATTATTTITTEHGRYPPHPPSLNTRRLSLPYYSSSEEQADELTLSHPLLSLPTKLLYFCISELLQPIAKAPHYAPTWPVWLESQDRTAYNRGGMGSLSGSGEEMGRTEYLREWRRRGERGNTMEDVDEVNWGWCARPPAVSPSSSSSTVSKWDFKDDDPSIERLAYANDVDTTVSPRWVGKAPPRSCSSPSKIPKSVAWDTDFCRLRLLAPNVRNVQRGTGGGMDGALENMRPGRVYKVGSIEGTWVGRRSFPDESSVRTILTSTSLTHTLEPSGPYGGRTIPEMGVYQKPIVMRFWEGYMMRGILEGAKSRATEAKTKAGAEGEEDIGEEGEQEEEDPFWTSIDPSPDVGDNMLNAWFPGFPGTTMVDVVAPGYVNPGGGEAEVDVEGWDGRRRSVRVGLSNGRASSGELLGNNSVQLDGEEEGEERERAERLFASVGLADEASSASSVPSSAHPSTQTTIESRTQGLGCTGIRSTIIFGTSGEERHGDAWGRYRYYGRVREWDGLVGVLRVPMRGRGPRPGGSSITTPHAAIRGETPPANSHPYSQFLAKHKDARSMLLDGELNDDEDDGDRGMLLFHGYVTNGGESFVGSWRSVGNGDTMDPGWEGSFVVGRRPD